MNTPIFSQITELIWKRFGSLESLSTMLSNGTGFAYPDLVENLNFDQIEKGCGSFQKNITHFVKVRELE